MNFVVIICSVQRPKVMHDTVRTVLLQDNNLVGLFYVLLIKVTSSKMLLAWTGV